MAVGNSDHLTLLNSYKVQIRRDGQETGLYSRASGCVILLESVCCGGKILRDSTQATLDHPFAIFIQLISINTPFLPPKILYKNFFSISPRYYSITVYTFLGGGGGEGLGEQSVLWVMRKLANFPLSSSFSFACHTNRPHPHALRGSRETRRMTGKKQV